MCVSTRWAHGSRGRRAGPWRRSRRARSLWRAGTEPTAAAASAAAPTPPTLLLAHPGLLGGPVGRRRSATMQAADRAVHQSRHTSRSGRDTDTQRHSQSDTSCGIRDPHKQQRHDGKKTWHMLTTRYSFAQLFTHKCCKESRVTSLIPALHSRCDSKTLFVQKATQLPALGTSGTEEVSLHMCQHLSNTVTWQF